MKFDLTGSGLTAGGISSVTLQVYVISSLNGGTQQRLYIANSGTNWGTTLQANSADFTSTSQYYPAFFIPRFQVRHVGVRDPVQDAGRRSVEVHLLGFEGDLYGTRLDVDLVRRLREGRRFAGPGPVLEQIRADLLAARQVLEGPLDATGF